MGASTFQFTQESSVPRGDFCAPVGISEKELEVVEESAMEFTLVYRRGTGPSVYRNLCSSKSLLALHFPIFTPITDFQSTSRH
ncbi:MAG: hypothetical protein ACJAZ8_001190 [Planctomycetota bacterium]|jgi:hypothetical protein